MKEIGTMILCMVTMIAVVSGLAGQDYTGHKMIRAYLEDEKQVAVVGSWDLDVWSRDSALGLGWNDIVVNDNHIADLLNLEVAYDVIIEDIVAHLEEGQRDLEESRKNVNALPDFFAAYHTHEEFAEYLQLIAQTYPTIATYIPSIGQSIQARNLFGIVLGPKTPKYKIFISGGQHAREWISPATVTYIITQLATGYSTNGNVKALLDSTAIHFIPIVNPDGYNYTWSGSSQRLWRKNRRANQGGSIGVDLNRNWNDHWGGEGSSKTPTSDTYCGTGPFSEPESKSVAAYVSANGPWKGAIDYHSYSQLILRPYGWTKTTPTNEALAKTVGDTIRAKILDVNKVAYTSEASWQLYFTTGSAQDWYFSEGAAALSYTIELRDTGTYGFQLPANQIKPTGAENWAGFLYFAQTAIAN